MATPIWEEFDNFRLKKFIGNHVESIKDNHAELFIALNVAYLTQFRNNHLQQNMTLLKFSKKGHNLSTKKHRNGNNSFNMVVILSLLFFLSQYFTNI